MEFWTNENETHRWLMSLKSYNSFLFFGDVQKDRLTGSISSSMFLEDQIPDSLSLERLTPGIPDVSLKPENERNC